MESFFGSLKTECVHRTRFATRKEARAALFDYIEVFYNRQRLHSGIGYKTPVQAYQPVDEVCPGRSRHRLILWSPGLKGIRRWQWDSSRIVRGT